jgi:hypothetical protein
VLAGLPIDSGGAKGREPASVAVVFDGLVGTLPRLSSTSELTDLALGFCCRNLLCLRRTVLRRQGPDLDVADGAVTELLVEVQGADVLDDDLEPDPADASLASLLVQRANERIADPRAPSRRQDAHAADPGILAPNAEVAEAHGGAVPEGDPRGVDVEVEDCFHRRERRLLDLKREHVALVRGREELRTLGPVEDARRAELDGQDRPRRGVPSLEASSEKRTAAPSQKRRRLLTWPRPSPCPWP